MRFGVGIHNRVQFNTGAFFTSIRLDLIFLTLVAAPSIGTVHKIAVNNDVTVISNDCYHAFGSQCTASCGNGGGALGLSRYHTVDNLSNRSV